MEHDVPEICGFVEPIFNDDELAFMNHHIEIAKTIINGKDDELKIALGERMGEVRIMMWQCAGLDRGVAVTYWACKRIAVLCGIDHYH